MVAVKEFYTILFSGITKTVLPEKSVYELFSKFNAKESNMFLYKSILDSLAIALRYKHGFGYHTGILRDEAFV